MKTRGRALLRAGVSAGGLALVAIVLDVGTIAERLGELRPAWVAVGLALSVAQALVLAWRWRFTAGRLGIDLPFRHALSEYYLGNLLNQVLPGGVTGDVSRAWRHARTEAPARLAVRAVVLERMTGQIVMTMVALLSLALVPALPGAARGGAVVVLAAAVGAAVGARDGLRSETLAAALGRHGLAIHLATGAFTVGTYVATYLVAARAVQIETPIVQLAPLVAPVLMTMLLPVTIAGWGVREAAAATLWGVVGLSAEDGVAISVTYGLLVLTATLPGALVLTGVVDRAPDRTGRPAREGSDAPADGARRSDSGSEEG